MDLLLDTHTLIWYLGGNSQISVKIKDMIDNPRNNIAVSTASIWEVSIKLSLGKIYLENGLDGFLQLINDATFSVIPISIKAIQISATLEFIHRDPFDRIMIAQCLESNLTFATKDTFITQYRVKTIW